MKSLFTRIAAFIFTILAVLGLTTPAFAAVDSIVAGKSFALSSQQRAVHGADMVVRLTHDMLTGTTTNATAQTIAILDVEAGVAVSVVKTVLKTPFKDSATAGFDSLLLEIGDGVDTDRLLTSTQLNENGTEVLQKIGTGVLYAYTSADTVDLLVTPKAGYTGAQLDTGEVWVYLRIHDDTALIAE